MQALIASYSTPVEVQKEQYLTSTVCTPRVDHYKSASLFVFAGTDQDEFALNKRIFSLLEEFSELKENWDEDGALAPNPESLSEAKFIAQTLEKIAQPIFNVAPGPNGEVLIDIRNFPNNKSVELIFYPSRTVAVFFTEKGTPFQEVYPEEVNLPRVLEWLNSIGAAE